LAKKQANILLFSVGYLYICIKISGGCFTKTAKPLAFIQKHQFK